MSNVLVSEEPVRAKHSVKTSPIRPAAAYRIEELAESGPIGRTSIFNAIRSGRLKARKSGRTTIVLAADWTSFLENLPSVKAA